MPAKRPVVDSDGRKYPSVSDAAAIAWVSVGTMHAALQATRRGEYRVVDEVQWAYADEIPEVWPSGVDQQEIPDCPKQKPLRFCKFCPYHNQKKD